ncbi:MAG: trigger factor [Firmicutes bacterium]|nr:trigger factor [Bacillota bacterium]
MKRKISVLGFCMIIGLVMLISGCGQKDIYDGINPGDYIKAGKYKGLETEKIKVEVTKQEMGDEISGALKSAAETKKVGKGKSVEDGDTVNINYVGRLNGKKFEGGSADKYDLTLGSGTFIDGFEDGLVGKKVGEKNIRLNLTFPEDYSTENLRGKDVVFTVSINSATRQVQPEYDDNFAKAQGYDSVEAYEKAVEEKIYNTKKEEEQSNQKNMLWSGVLENTKVKKYPEDVVKHYKDVFSAQIDEQAESGDVKRTQILSMYGVKNEKELDKMIEESAQLLVKQELIIEYIAETEKLTNSDDEIKNTVESLKNQGYDDEKVEKETGRNLEQYAHISLLYQKVQDFIFENAKVVD